MWHANSPFLDPNTTYTRRMTMKGAIVLAAAIVAVALGACRREEAAPMKLGADLPAATEVAR
jgi:hypothetical protein